MYLSPSFSMLLLSFSLPLVALSKTLINPILNSWACTVLFSETSILFFKIIRLFFSSSHFCNKHYLQETDISCGRADVYLMIYSTTYSFMREGGEMSKLKTRKTIPTLRVGWGGNECGFPSVKVLGVSRLSALLLLGAWWRLQPRAELGSASLRHGGFMRSPFEGQWYGTVEKVPDVIFYCTDPAGVAPPPAIPGGRSKGGNDTHFLLLFLLKSMDNIIFIFFFKQYCLRTSEFLKWAYLGMSGEQSPESAAQAFLLNTIFSLSIIT